MEFPINTQEEFDAAIQKRLERESAKYENKYRDFNAFREKAGKYDDLLKQDYPGQMTALQAQLSEAQAQLAAAQEKLGAHDKTVADLTARAMAAETANLRAKVAHAHNIPFELAERLSGTTEEEMSRDAELLGKFVAKAPAMPLASTEPSVTGGAFNTTDAALMQVAAALGTP